jgi:mannose-1-phosphate guanylyltransferase
MNLHAIVFAGGAGQRLWPLSRRNSPKQFAPLLESKSSIQLAVDRLSRLVPAARIFVGTNSLYSGILREQLPAIPESNFFFEPSRQDVAAGVALAFFALEKSGVRGPIVFQWSDHYVSKPDALLELFRAGTKLVEADSQRMVIITEEPRFANDNLGWIEIDERKGEVGGVPHYSFDKWVYRPAPDLCQKMFASKKWAWNTGHFVTSVEFITSSFRTYAPELAQSIEEIVSYFGTAQQQAKLEELFPKLPRMSFDHAILEKIPRSQALLLKGDLGWVDPGNLNALKEAIERAEGLPAESTVTRGNVAHLNTSDTFIYNATDRPVVALGVSRVVVVELPDVTLIVDKASVRDLPTLLLDLQAKGFGSLL